MSATSSDVSITISVLHKDKKKRLTGYKLEYQAKDGKDAAWFRKLVNGGGVDLERARRSKNIKVIKND